MQKTRSCAHTPTPAHWPVQQLRNVQSNPAAFNSPQQMHQHRDVKYNIYDKTLKDICACMQSNKSGCHTISPHRNGRHHVSFDDAYASNRPIERAPVLKCTWRAGPIWHETRARDALSSTCLEDACIDGKAVYLENASARLVGQRQIGIAVVPKHGARDVNGETDVITARWVK
jgi:hypothetical protein